MIKNTASQSVPFKLINATTGAAITTGTVVVTVTIDGGTPTTGTGTTAHKINGTWIYTPSQAETNGNTINFDFSIAGGIPTDRTYETVSYDPHNISNLGLTNLDVAISTRNSVTPIAPDNTSIAAILADTNELQLNQGNWLTATGFSTYNAATDSVKLPTIPANWITATGIAANAFNGKGDWNIGKTGYVLSQSFPANFSDLKISLTTGNVTVGTNNDKSGYSITGTKTTLDSLNDIAAASIVSAGPITTLNGAVANVDLVDVTTTNTDMRGTDSANTVVPDNTSITSILNNTNTIDSKITNIQGSTFNPATDSLEAIRNRGDSSWTTGAGGTPPQLLQTTTIATLASQTSFTLTAGSTDDGAYNGAIIVVTDNASSVRKAVGSVSNYIGITKTIILVSDPAVFVMGVGDTVEVIANASTSATAADIRTEIDTNSTKLAAILTDTSTTLPNQISSLNNFNPATDTVANITLPAAPTNWITFSSIAANALNGKGDWNIGKTGYTTTQTYPTNFSDLKISATTGRVDINVNNDKSGYSIAGTKTTLDSLNDIQKTDVVSAGPITTLNGAVVNVDLVDVTTTNTDMRGTDSVSVITPTGIRAAIGLAAANIDTQLSTLNSLSTGNNNTLTTINTTINSISTNTSVDIPGLINALNDLDSAAIKTAVLSALSNPTTEPLTVPAETANIIDKLSFIFAFNSNKLLQTNALQTLRNKADTADISSAIVSKDSTTTTRANHV